MADFEVKGVTDLQSVLARALDKIKEQSGQALYEVGNVVKGTSMERTPVKTGALRGSHTVSEPTISDEEVSVTIAVGGPAAPYAVYVHENLMAHHDVGQAKFLESAANEAAPEFASEISKRISLGDAVTVK